MKIACSHLDEIRDVVPSALGAANASASLLIVSCANESTIPAFTIDGAGVLTAAAPLDGGGTSGGAAIVHKSS